MEKKGYIYFMTNGRNTVLYIGVTNSLKRRILEHANDEGSIFTRKYLCTKLVYYETYDDIETAISREKKLKHLLRSQKNALVNDFNPSWSDLGPALVTDPMII